MVHQTLIILVQQTKYYLHTSTATTCSLRRLR